MPTEMAVAAASAEAVLSRDPVDPVDAADAPTVVACLVAPASWRSIDFISDLHLAEDTPQAIDAWAHYLERTTADAVFILGDLFEAWPGDDARVDAFEGRCAGILKAASAKRFMAFMVGNRDFLVGRDLLTACNVRSLDDPTVLEAFGGRALLSHGDAWCLADTDYLRLRTQVRSAAWKRQVLAQTLAQRRALARHLREQSERQAATRSAVDWADVDPALARAWLQANDTPLLIHGHTHHAGRSEIAPGFRREVLSDWDLDHQPGQGRAEVLRWQAEGFVRLTPAAATSAAPTMPTFPTPATTRAPVSGGSAASAASAD